MNCSISSKQPMAIFCKRIRSFEAQPIFHLWKIERRISFLWKWSDDRRINNYSCSNEISSHAYAYNHETSVLEGIGVFIHEFSHKLGLMDMYDVSKSNKRESVGYWSVMANFLFWKSWIKLKWISSWRCFEDYCLNARWMAPNSS